MHEESGPGSPDTRPINEGNDITSIRDRRDDVSVPTPGFSDLVAPAPTNAAPPVAARLIAFAAIITGGLLGGLVGYGIGNILYPDSLGSALGAVGGALTGSIGLGVLANLTLRAMNEWRSVEHPEASRATAGKRSTPESGR